MPSSAIIITTWPFGLAAGRAGYRCLASAASALDAVETAANVTELDPDVSSVGYGGLPNADGVVELDAAIMHGPGHTAGAVAGLVNVKRAISVARAVMETTPHVMLVGEGAVRFARSHGFPEEDLLTPRSLARWHDWKASHAAADVAHFERKSDTNGDRVSASISAPHGIDLKPTPDDHDTIGLCAIDMAGNLAAGCTTSGMAWKVPGRVGDSPLIGSGLYVDNEVGAAAATGHGDEIMKVCLSYRVVGLMQRGLTPQQACEEALRYLLRMRPADAYGNYGAAVIAL